MNNVTETPVVLLDFWCDLQCPDCHRALGDLQVLQERFPSALEIRLRHFPLPRHRYAHTAAQAAEEARAQGQEDAFVTALLTRTAELGKQGPRMLTALAAELGLDAEEMDTALVDGRHLLVVDADQAEGAALGVTGTPTYVIGGERFDGGRSQEGLRERIAEKAERLLRRDG
ncbi:DsbA family protein [Streptomyces sp. ACA25]|uniref:DsbA family protein n=1 Tax=Streptomyces sp. ACA25 TaxID=3022596 RepID=UPI0023080A23|nr:DsbA family protein [Streptomyces sp. ACA25]MDB1088954.1 DsbA family protein [Streptomyces sp. ACA25]